MANSAGGGSGDVFDVRRVRKLVELMDEHDLGEIVLQQGEQKMKLRRGPEPAIIAATPAAPAAPAAAPAPARARNSRSWAKSTPGTSGASAR